MSTIAQLVEELVLETRQGDHRGDALLTQLRNAIGGNLGSSKSGASSGAPLPIDVGAFTLWEDITGQIAAAFTAATDMRPNRAPEVNLLGWHTAFTAAGDRGDTTLIMHEVAGERLAGWAQRIRDHFAAPRTREVMVTCPNCGYERITLGEDVNAEEQYALVATIREGVVTVSCRNPLCVDAFGERSAWTGEHQLAELGRRTGNPIALADIQAALAEQPAEEWHEDLGKQVEDFDPNDPEHAALVGGKPIHKGSK